MNGTLHYRVLGESLICQITDMILSYCFIGAPMPCHVNIHEGDEFRKYIWAETEIEH